MPRYHEGFNHDEVTMRVVVVGAGAVGQVYGGFLDAGGAEVAFRVRHPEKVVRPLRLYPLRGDRTPQTYDAAVFGTDAEVTAFGPHLVLLTVPSDALRGEWLKALLDAVPSASVVALEPGVHEAAVIRAARPEVELTQGIIALIAYQAPLPGESFDPPGVAYWLPPLASAPFEGPAAERISEVLRRGGMPARARTGLAATSAFGSARMGIYVTALRAVGWSFGALDRGTLGLASQAVAEANEVIAAETGQRVPFGLRLVGPTAVKAALAVGARVLPLPLETYLRVHFTKVGKQTEEALRGLIAAAERQGRGVPALRELVLRAFA